MCVDMDQFMHFITLLYDIVDVVSPTSIIINATEGPTVWNLTEGFWCMQTTET